MVEQVRSDLRSEAETMIDWYEVAESGAFWFAYMMWALWIIGVFDNDKKKPK